MLTEIYNIKSVKFKFLGTTKDISTFINTNFAWTKIHKILTFKYNLLHITQKENFFKGKLLQMRNFFFLDSCQTNT